MKKIKILDCGPSLEDVSRKFGQSPEWIMSCLRRYNCEFDWVKTYSGERKVDDPCDAWIITGSPRSVYEEDDWMLELENDIKMAEKNNIFILGICFGHQIIAKSFGGKVELNPKGWELGSYSINLTSEGKKSPLFNNFKDNDIVYESHQDYVSLLPTNAIPLAYSDKCIQSFQISNFIFSVQFHPEFSLEIMKKYVAVRSNYGVPIDNDTISKSVNGELILSNFINLF